MQLRWENLSGLPTGSLQQTGAELFKYVINSTCTAANVAVVTGDIGHIETYVAKGPLEYNMCYFKHVSI